MKHTYKLFLKHEDGTEAMIAEAEGSPFWTEIYLLAEKMYGKENVYYTFS